VLCSVMVVKPESLYIVLVLFIIVIVVKTLAGKTFVHEHFDTDVDENVNVLSPDPNMVGTVSTPSPTHNSVDIASSFMYYRIMTTQNLATPDEAKAYFNQLSSIDKTYYLSFDNAAPEFQDIVQARCGTTECFDLPDFPTYPSAFLHALQNRINDYLQLTSSQPANQQSILSLNGNCVLDMDDVTWWNWYMSSTPIDKACGQNSQISVASPIISSDTQQNNSTHTLQLFLYYLNSNYMQNPNRLIPNLYIIQSIRKLLTNKSWNILPDNSGTNINGVYLDYSSAIQNNDNDFTKFIKSCFTLDPDFAAKMNIPAGTFSGTIAMNGGPTFSGIPLINAETQNTLRYYQYKASYSISAFRQFILDTIELFDCAQRVLILIQSSSPKTPNISKKLQTLNTSFNQFLQTYTIYPECYNTCKDFRIFEQALIQAPIDHGVSLEKYLNETYNATNSSTLVQLANSYISVIHSITASSSTTATATSSVIATVSAPAFVNYTNLVNHFQQNISDTDTAAWLGWVQLLNDSYLNGTRTPTDDTALVKKYLCSNTCMNTDPVITAMNTLIQDTQARNKNTNDMLSEIQIAKRILYMLLVICMLILYHGLGQVDIGITLTGIVVMILIMLYLISFQS
jgi:hypothetical protein